MIDYDLRLLMPDKITVELPLAKNAYSRTVYGPPVPYQARIEQSVQLVRDQDGREKVSNVQVYLATQIRIPLATRITLPDGSTPSILSIDSVQDEDGAYFTKVST